MTTALARVRRAGATHPGAAIPVACVALLMTGSAWAQFDSGAGGASAGGAVNAGGAISGGGFQNAGGAIGGGGIQNTGGAIGAGDAQNAGGAIAAGGFQNVGGAIAAGGIQNVGGFQNGTGGIAAGGIQNAGGAMNTGGAPGADCTTDAECAGPDSCVLCTFGAVVCSKCENRHCSYLYRPGGACISGGLDYGMGSFCGNGYLNVGLEECDGTDQKGATCQSATMGALPYGKPYCSTSCTLVLTGCSASPISTGGETDGGSSASACTPGQQIACACSSGGSGVQICASDGARFESCQCSPDDGGVSASSANSADTGGCGCRIGAGARPASPLIAALALVLIGRLRRNGRQWINSLRR